MIPPILMLLLPDEDLVTIAAEDQAEYKTIPADRKSHFKN